MEKKKNTPKLRFPEFTGEWEEKKLGEIAENISYGMNAPAISYDGVNKYLRITDIDESSRLFYPKPLTSPDGLIEEKFKLREGDLVFARTGASVGKSYLYKKSDGNLYFAGFLIRFSIINENPLFIFTQTLNKPFYKWVQLMSMRSGQPGINAEEYKEFPIFLTSLAEQTKIATFLTAVDEKLTQLKKKKTLLEQYKKGVMQKLFSQELRFKDDNNQDFPDWQEKTLGDVANSISSGKSKTKDCIGEYPLYGSTGIIGYSSKYDYCGINILIARVGANAGSLYVVDGKYSISDNTLVLNLDNNTDVFFIYNLLIKCNLNKMVFGSGQPLVTGGQIKNMNIMLPSLPEQQKIANFLSAIDEKISHCGAQIEKMEAWKKGLLQQMFC
ncbi:restriction endonuclease subunit S [Macellibacteroides fermentans]|uniref:restriction endonuclease subunit S n=1 Tax=Macellibacteroides fermentans TaxID=879969 RepID=UPI00406CA045